MTRSRFRLIAFTGLYVGWLSYLGYAALVRKPPMLVSQSQLLGSTGGIVAEVRVEDGKPNPAVTIKSGWGKFADMTGQHLRIENLRLARLPNGATFELSGLYAIPLDGEPNQGYRIAVSPKSPGYDTPPADPVIYPWTDNVQSQFQRLLPDAKLP